MEAAALADLGWDSPEPETPALSPSIAHALVTECPRQAWAEHRLLGNCITLSSDQLARRERGAALHNIVLEGGDRLAKVDADSWRSQAARDARADARASGLIPVLASDADELAIVADRIAESLAALGISLAGGVAEEKLHWEERTEIGEILCTGVIDWRDNAGRIVDLKTTEGSVHPDACAAVLTSSAAVIQDCAYRSAVASMDPGLAGRTSVLFLFAQSRAPYMVTPVTCDGALRHIGESRWIRAKETWARCLAGGREAKHWPQHVDRPIEVHPPAWVLARELALEGQET
jgi:hypothetical protein